MNRHRNHALTCGIMLFVAVVLTEASIAHDLFLKLRSFFLAPDSDVTVSLINGTFDQSENSIARDRMLDISIVGPEREIEHPAKSDWRDEDNATLLDFRTGSSGTYTLGVSTAPRVIELSAEDFNEYLRHDGVVDTLQQRTEAGELDTAARERYSKHVKAVVQVGEDRSSGFDANLGYPVEFIPMQNPYQLDVGDSLDVRFLKDGQPVANQMIYASHEGFHRHDESGHHVEAFSARTDADGIVTVPLSESGRWYLRTIHMEKIDHEDADYQSTWATLTFEVAGN
ncbi:MAG: DUF4198 domain-containing protein [Pirellulaceae bacterium]